ncbi:hypothetical protein Sa4125_32080 [Aureimonas sp. SA4125]|nr:hypothetical protein Sa4125_32080 [Aureimonas sp. SA4125]
MPADMPDPWEAPVRLAANPPARQSTGIEALPEPDAVPYPELASGFVLADLIPGRHSVMDGVSFIGGQARAVVTGAASGALDFVRH